MRASAGVRGGARIAAAYKQETPFSLRLTGALTSEQTLTAREAGDKYGQTHGDQSRGGA